MLAVEQVGELTCDGGQVETVGEEGVCEADRMAVDCPLDAWSSDARCCFLHAGPFSLTGSNSSEGNQIYDGLHHHK